MIFSFFLHHNVYANVRFVLGHIVAGIKSILLYSLYMQLLGNFICSMEMYVYECSLCNLIYNYPMCDAYQLLSVEHILFNLLLLSLLILLCYCIMYH